VGDERPRRDPDRVSFCDVGTVRDGDDNDDDDDDEEKSSDRGSENGDDGG